jgi:uncharacterized protein (TIGR02452 family)
VEVAKKKAKDTGERVGILNPASAGTPGGGESIGAGALEEHLCRVSDLLPQLKALKDKYPLKGCVNLPNVQFFRGEECRGAPFEDECITLGALVAAALNAKKSGRSGTADLGKVTMQGSMDSKMRDEMTRRAKELVFAAENNFDHAIFTAWGCGAFCLPPDDMACIFKEVLRGSTLKSVTFAILERFDLPPGAVTVRERFEKILCGS